MNDTAISVIIPTHNRAHLITRAIDSVLMQALPDDELIIIDDGSEDDTASVVSKYGKKIKYIQTVQGGAGVARNIGIRESSRPLVTFLDSDDAWMPTHNILLRNIMKARPDLLFCFTNYAARFPDTTVRRFALELHHGYELNWEEIMGPSKMASTMIELPEGVDDFPCYESDKLYRSLCSQSYICVSTLIVRKEEAGDSFKFAEDTSTAEEWECGARLARKGKSLYLHSESAWIFHHFGNRLTNADMFEYATSRIKFRKRIWGADADFLVENRDLYDAILREEKILRVEGFLLQGRSREAREEMADLRKLPMSYRILAAMPGVLTKALLDARRFFKSIIRPAPVHNSK